MKTDQSPNLEEDAFHFPWAFICTLLIALIIESVAYVNLERSLEKTDLHEVNQIPEISHTIVQAKIEFILQKDSNTDLLIAGDSSGLMGIEAKLLEKETGYRTLNLGTLGWLGVAGHRFLLEQYIKRHGAPKIVLFHSAPQTWGFTKEQLKMFGWEALVKRRLGQVDTKYKRKYEKLPSQNFRYIAQKKMLPEAFHQHFLIVPRGGYRSHNDLLKYLKEHNGSMDELAGEEAPLSEEDKKKEKEQKPKIAEEDVPKIITRISQKQINELQKLIALSEKENFLLLVVCNPVAERFRSAYHANFLEEMEQKIIGATVGHEAHVKVHQPLIYYFPDRSCASLNHLHPKAKSEYTQKLGMWINKLKSLP